MYKLRNSVQIVGYNRIIFSFLSDSVIAKMPELPRNYSFKTAHRIKTTSHHNINQSHAATDRQEEASTITYIIIICHC